MSHAHVNFTQSRFGITTSLESNTYDSSGEPENRISFRFFIKRDGILRRWNAIENELDLPSIISLRPYFHRSLAYFTPRELKHRKLGVSFKDQPQKEVDKKRVYSSEETLKFVDTTLPRYKRESNMDYYLANRKVNRYGQFIPKESVEIIISKPYVFSMDFNQELSDIMDLKKKIVTINTLLKCKEKLALAEGNTLFQEYEPFELNNLTNFGSKYPPENNYLSSQQMPSHNHNYGTII